MVCTDNIGVSSASDNLHSIPSYLSIDVNVSDFIAIEFSIHFLRKIMPPLFYLLTFKILVIILDHSFIEESTLESTALTLGAQFQDGE
jgi:hypothetical protein